MSQPNPQPTPSQDNEEEVSPERDIILTESGFTIDRTKGEITSNPDWQNWLNESAEDLSPLWTVGHMGGEEQEGVDTFSNVIEHTAVVDANAITIARAIIEAGVPVDIEVVHIGAVLHDIGKRAQIELGENPQSNRGAVVNKALLWHVQRVYPAVSDEMIRAALFTGRVGEMFLEEGMEEAIRAMPIECLIVALADATVRNTKPVSIKEAFEANVKKKSSDRLIYEKWFVFYSEVARHLKRVTGGKFDISDITADRVLVTAQKGLNSALGRNTSAQ